MHATRFDALTRSLGTGASRRGALAGVLGALGALGAGALPLVTGLAKSKKSRNRKKNRPKPNAYGCLNVGQKCNGKNSKCCSGICQGKKPKRGKKDKRRCVAHDTGGCVVSERQCGAKVPTCTTSVNRVGGCLTTTGNGPYCADFITGHLCSKDADCRAVCGPLAACFIDVCDNNRGHCAGPGECAPS
jgi:hypothetical protein